MTGMRRISTVGSKTDFGYEEFAGNSGLREHGVGAGPQKGQRGFEVQFHRNSIRGDGRLRGSD